MTATKAAHTEFDPRVAAGQQAVAAAGNDVRAQASAALAWAYEVFGNQMTVASSMGDEVLFHLASVNAPGVDVLFLDTGYHFAETIGTRDAIGAVYDVNVRTILPLLTIEQQTMAHGVDLWSNNPDACCAIRKVEPLERGLATYAAWVTGMRREDAPTRTDIDVVGWDARRGKVKLNPLAEWTQEDLDSYVEEFSVLQNPLRQLGYSSIGCAPCTRAIRPGEDPRAGRWSGTGKVECGLHS
jgi:phosphoadenosine phosphosulfate reductase